MQAHISEAEKLGASHQCHETILKWSANSKGIEVVTDRGRCNAAKLIICAGSWTSQLLAELDISLRIIRKHQHWYAVDDPDFHIDNNCPCYFFEANGGYFYGCPEIENGGLKVAEHSGGIEIADPLADPDSPEVNDTHRVEEFLKQHLPRVSNRRVHHERCFYTQTNDEHFVVDRHPDHQNVVFATGLSGHGFKFTTVLGQILADITLQNSTELDIDFLRLSRDTLGSS